MVPTIRQRVARGAMLLDEHRPGWYLRTDLDRLDMGQSQHCVLGQEYADEWRGYAYTVYSHAIERLRGILNRKFYDHGCLDVQYGFDAQYPDTDDREYHLLDVAWTREITRRRNAHAVREARERAAPVPVACPRRALGDQAGVAEHAPVRA